MFTKYNRPFFHSASHLSSRWYSAFPPAKLNHIFVPCSNESISKPTNLIALHGLLGSAMNFNQIVNKPEISSKVNSYLLDLRNHGKAEHKDSMTYPEMAADVYKFMLEQELLDQNNILLGFSMGARLAMEIAVTYPELFKGVALVDLAPHDYINDKRFSFVDTMNRTLEKLCRIDLNKERSSIKKDIMDAAFSKDAGEVINSNVIPNEEGGYKWRLNVQSIYNNLISQILNAKYEGYDTYSGPVRIILGAESEYTSKDIIPSFHYVFDNLDVEKELVIVDNAGHWVHSSQPKEFINIISKFINEII